MSKLSSTSREYLNRIKDTVARTSALGRLSDWNCNNTFLHGRPYTFKGHEYAKDIMDTKHPNVAIIKPSQIGMSETTARLVLGFLAVQNNTTAIYTLPTVNEALRFVKARFDPIIETSPYLKSILSSGNDSSSFKKLGGSMLYSAGTHGKDFVSVPADLTVCDEVDFSNERVLKSIESRLSHSRFLDEATGIRGVRRWLSTPSVAGVGISAMFARSDKRRRLVRCKHCTEWFFPNFLENVVVQGYDRPLDQLTAEDVIDLDDRGLLPTAKIICPSCHGEITKQNLYPEYREWVAELPHIKDFVGYQCSAFDLPDFHTAESLFRKRIEYGNEESQFYNYSLGLPYDSSSNSFSAEAIRNNTVLEPNPPHSPAHGCVLGLDVGRTSWLVIAKPYRINGITEMHVIWAEQIRVEDDNLFQTVCERIRQFGVVRAVVDAMPFTDSMLRIQAQFGEGVVLPCMYTLTDRNLPSYVIKESSWSVSANRTKCFDQLAQDVHRGKVKFAKFPEMGTMLQHFQNIKRVERREGGEVTEATWVKVNSNDHYSHAVLYAHIGCQTITAGEYLNFSPRVSIKEAFVGRQYQQQQENR